MHSLLSCASNRRQNNCVVVRHDLDRVRVDGFLPVDYCFLGRRRRLVDRRGTVGMFDHLMEDILVGLRGVCHMMGGLLLVGHFRLK